MALLMGRCRADGKLDERERGDGHAEDTASCNCNTNKHKLKSLPASLKYSFPRTFAVVTGNAFSSIIRPSEEGRELPSCQEFDILCNVRSLCEEISVRDKLEDIRGKKLYI